MSKYTDMAERLEAAAWEAELHLSPLLSPVIVDVAAAIRRLVAENERLERVLDSRAGRLLLKGTPFFVVKASEPYAAQVVDLIRQHEGESWTGEDEAWACAALDKREGE